eukprot:3635305-Prymnesium_polylepis.1
MPPLIPGPSGFTTVATPAQLQAAVNTTPPHDSLLLYLPPGSVFRLGGMPIIVGPIDLLLASD